MKLDIRKLGEQLRSITADVVPLMLVSLVVFVALLVLGSLSYVSTGVDFNGLVVGNPWQVQIR